MKRNRSQPIVPLRFDGPDAPGLLVDVHRYVLENRVEAFHLDWAAAWAASQVQARDPAPFFPLARAFLDDINLPVGEETNA